MYKTTFGSQIQYVLALTFFFLTLPSSGSVGKLADIVITIDSQTDASCPGTSDGSINISVSGGTPGYTYQWTGPNSFSSNSQDISNLAGGAYTITVTDSSTPTPHSETTEITVGDPDNTNPIITAPADISENTDNSDCNASNVILGTPTTNDNCGVTSVSNDAPADFPLGETTVIWTVTDNTGNTATDTQKVIISDNTDPTITAPADVQANTDSNDCNASSVSLGTPTTADNCGVTSVSNNAPADFPLGETTVIWTVTDNSGNSSTDTQIVTVTDNTSPTVNTTGVTVSLDATGQISITASDIDNNSTDNCGIQSYTLSKTNFDCSSVGNNNVTLTVTDVNGNSSSATATAIIEDNINPTISTSDITVQLDANGQASITASDIDNNSTDNCGISTYSLSKTDFDCTNVGNNTVMLTVTDVNGNSSSATATVIVEDNINPTVNASDITVQLDANGQASITASDIDNNSTDNCGIDSYSLSKSDFDCSNVGNNTVTLTVTDINGNSNSATATVIVEDNIKPTISQGSDITENNDPGQCEASVNITAATVTDNCTANAPAGTRDDGLAIADPYPVGTTIITWNTQDANGNQATPVTQQITVVDNEAPVLPEVEDILWGCEYTVEAPTATDNCSGNITGTTSDPLTYSTSGTYNITWTFTDTAGNSAQLTQKITIDELTLEISSTPVDCNGANTGSVSGSASGGVIPYTYNWTNLGSGDTKTNQPAGTYELTVTDANGCAVTKEVVITEPDVLSMTAPSSTEVTCFGGTDGNITAGTVSGGTAPYLYSLDNTNFSSTTNFIDLAAGDYTIFVKDANDCALQESITITQPDELNATVNKTNVNCYAGNDGTITFSGASGGKGTYEYSIDGAIWQNNTAFTNLTAGTYPAYIRDASNTNCEILLGNIDVTEPASPLTVSITSTRTTSFGSSTGSATANSSGGTPGYTYEWRRQENSAVIQTTKTANNLSAGTYEVTITDTKGCTITESVTIIDALEASIASRSICEDVENEDAIRTSFFEVNEQTAYGGVAPYTYSWDFGTGATNPTRTGVGEHTVYYNSTGNKTVILTVTDSSGESITVTQQNYVGKCYEPCGKSENFVFNPDNIYIGDVNGNPVNITTVNNCTNTVDKYIFIQIDKSANAYNPYVELIYKISNTINGTSSVEFANGCREGDNIDDDPNDNKENKIGEFVKLTLNPINFNCGDNLDIENFYITWTNVGHKKCGQNNNAFCYSSNEPVIVPTPLSAEATPQDVLCKGNNTGTISTQVSGGYAPYSYNLTGHNDTYQNSNTFNNLPAGSYTVYVRDSRNNTTESNVVVIDEPVENITLATTVADPACFGETGTATVTASGGTPNSSGEAYQYLWNDATEQTTATAIGLSAGNYTVTVIDANGCQQIASVVITEPAELTMPDAGEDQSLGCGNFTTNLNANTPTVGVGTWSIDEANSTAGGSIADTSDPVSEFTGPQGTFTLVWTIANTDGTCAETDTTVITLEGECSKLDFDGVDDHVYFDDNYGFTTGNFTIEVWVKPEAVSGIRTILSKRDKSNLASGGYDLIINNGAPTFRWNGKNATTSSKLTTSRWYHLAVIFSGNTARLYVDGIEVGNSTSSNPSTITAPLILGAMHDSASPEDPKNYYSGWMEEFRVWNSALSQEQLRFMMNQRIESNAGNTKGEVLPMNVPGPLAWSNLKGYYHLNPSETINGETLDISGSPVNGILMNIETDQKISAPLPYISEASGSWRDRTTWDTNIGNAQEKWWDVPNGIGINGDFINWNIVETSHNINSSAQNIYVLGLLSNSQELKIDGNVPNETGQGLTVTHYLKLDGTINLEGNSQLVQTEGSILDETSTGYIDIDQQGTANSFNYNYWTSPVSLTGSSNNSGYKVSDVLLDATNPSDPQNIIFNNQFHWADGNYSGAKRVSSYWLNTFGDPDGNFNGDANDYFAWHQFEETDLLPPGIGYTMKGTTGYVPVSNKQNYTFRGKPNNGDITVSVAVDQNLLTGNPYPSAIDARRFIQDNLSDFNGSIYLWDHFGPVNSHYLEEYIGGYAVYNLSGGVASASSIDSRIDATGDRSTKAPPGQYIPVGQAFFVNTQGVSNPTSITYKNEYRAFVPESSNDSQFHMQEDVETKKGQNSYSKDSRFKIRLKFESPKGYHRQILVTADANTTSGFDLGYDAPLIENNVEDMYWMIEDTEFVIQAVPDFNLDQVLPIGIKIAEEGGFTIKVDELENFKTDFDVYLKDMSNETYINLSNESYTATADETGSFNERYQIVFRKPEAEKPETEIPVEEETEITEDPTLGLQYLRETDEISLLNPDLMDVDFVELFSISGQLIKTFTEVPTRESVLLSIDQKLSSAVYIVKVYSGQKSYSKKVIISK